MINDTQIISIMCATAFIFIILIFIISMILLTRLNEIEHKIMVLENDSFSRR